MSKMLKPLLLPQLVEERRKRESLLVEGEMDFSSVYDTQNSSTSDIQTPVTPTFSARSQGHLRYSSSSSSMDTLQTPALGSPSSPIFNSMKSGQRSLPDVQEEPQEREEDLDDLYDCFCDDQQCVHRDPAMTQSTLQLSKGPEYDYDLADGFFSDGEVDLSPRTKKRRATDSPFTAFAWRLGCKLPSFTRKWTVRKSNTNPLSRTPTPQQTYLNTAGSTSRSSSLASSTPSGYEQPNEPQLPPTPTRSEFGDAIPVCPIDIDMANRDTGNRDEQLASTPLLPPLMMDASANTKSVIYHSPLQSPSVADPADPFSQVNTPIDAVSTPQLSSVPSPPLSNKASISSFHRVNLGRPGNHLVSPEMRPIIIADENDVWANKLGHANFTIQPEPYIPEMFDVEACRQLRANWDLARCNYTKHLVRTGEHYGATSITYKLTEEKWTEVDAIWKTNNDLTIEKTSRMSGDAFSTLRHTTLGDPSASNIMTKIPSLNDPLSGGKFPQLGDEDIVGPMVQATAQLQRSPSKKVKLMKFFAERIPTGFGRSVSQP